MTRRKVDRIEPVSAIDPSNPVSVCQTNSILTDPDGRWVAARQSAITAAMERLDPTKDAHRREKAPTFSGENERIGKQADSRTRFGNGVFYI
ncbi:hypothetical protein [Agrobacterium vitis]|uniref:hypothetical protein n=1 Tax=Agrobacterium vitis TaxID=373 RepID=UPI001574845E|nr:hypothetical protein [Agrobacterium vitis]NSY14869.1 hypothetical protein [Agrobacterium vitis]NSY24626.1 hypothetical protein [Agrobacterium vitis]WEO75254.1 hypothetical protein G6L01_026910 [Agrobacterium vitis]